MAPGTTGAGAAGCASGAETRHRTAGHRSLDGTPHDQLPPWQTAADLPRCNGLPVLGESRAWVEWWLGEWTGHDPTNDAEVGERHVIVGRGRDHIDAPPIKGIVAGLAESDLAVTVEITRLA